MPINRSLLLSSISLLFALQFCAPHSNTRVNNPAAQGESAYKIYTRALEMYAAQNFEQAGLLADSAIALNDRIASFYDLRAKIFRARGNYSAAVRHYKKVLRLRGKNPAILEELAGLYRQMNVPDSAIIYFEKTVSQNTDRIELFLQIADIYLTISDTGQARYYTRLYSRQAENEGKIPVPEYYRLMARISYLEGDFQQTVHFYEQCCKSIRLAENDHIFWLKALFRLQREDEAYQYLSALKKGALPDAEIYYLRGLYFQQKKNAKAALEQFKLARILHTREKDVYYHLARLLLLADKKDEARDMLMRYKELEPDGVLEAELEKLIKPEIP